MKAVAAALMLAVACPALAAERAPDFALTLLDGRTVRSDELKGRVVILNRWATWCVPCRQELKDIEALVARHGGAVAAYAVDSGGPAGQREVAARARTMTIPVAIGFAQGEAAYRPIRQAIPSTYLIDRDGRLVLARAGAFAPGELERMVAPYLGPLNAGYDSAPSEPARRNRSADRP